MLRPTLRSLVELYVRTGRWSRRLVARFIGHGPHGSGGRVFRPRLELLEAREMPSVNFDSVQTFALATGDIPIGITAADVNGDGRPDIVAAADGASAVLVLLNTTPAGASTPSFAPQQSFATDTTPAGVTTADVNGDGRPDILTANFTANSVSVLLNTTPAGASTPSFAPQQSFAAGNNSAFLATADINGDGRADILTSNFTNDDTVSVLLNTTPVGASIPTFAAHQDFTTGDIPIDISAADVNGDGRPDLLVANFNDNTVSVLLNTTPVGASIPTLCAFMPPDQAT
jgi:hypothetical protein